MNWHYLTLGIIKLNKTKIKKNYNTFVRFAGRTLLAAKRDYRYILKKKRRRLLDHYVDKSLKTSYSKIEHVIDPRFDINSIC